MCDTALLAAVPDLFGKSETWVLGPLRRLRRFYQELATVPLNGANRIEASDILLSFSTSTELAQLCNKRRSRHTLRETKYSRTDSKLVHSPGA